MTAINPVTDLTRDGEVAVLTLNSPPVNALSAPVRDGLALGIAAAEADPAVKAIVLICAGRTFIAGADITEFGKPAVKSASLFDVQEAMENSKKPIIAAIHGTALGGGLEVALTCHYRIAAASAKCGLPEVKLGLLPGAGGTQRLPRLVGPEIALDLVTSGRHVGAKEALKMGVFDEVVADDQLKDAAIAMARKAIAEKWPLRLARNANDKVDAARPNAAKLFADFRAQNAKLLRGFEAPEANIQCIEAAVNLPFDEGLKVERALFVPLMQGLQSRAQRYVFFAERMAAKIDSLPADTAPLPVKSVGIIGAGTMGGGIAMNFLNVGIPVTIVEMKEEALTRGVGVIRKNYENTAAKGKLSAADVEGRMGMLKGSLDLGDLAQADLIIEAVFENMAIKKELFAKLDGIAKPGAILASNTSYLNVDEIASATKRPGSVLGMHFFSPANVMRLLEVVNGAKTEPAVLATAMAIGKKIGKIAVVSGVCHGFIGNRMLSFRQQQAQKLILEGALPADIDRVLYDFGFPMGPFQMSDLAGLDIGWNAETSKGETIRDRMCEAGMRGQKNGKGFYNYDAQRNRTPSPEAEKIILDYAAERGINRRKIDDEEILERCLLPMVNEGALILEEKMAQRASDIDIVWLNGYGWPVYRGGPMFWADHYGLAKVVERLKHYGITPAPLLEKLAAKGETFTGQ